MGAKMQTPEDSEIQLLCVSLAPHGYAALKLSLFIITLRSIILTRCVSWSSCPLQGAARQP